MSAPSQNGNNTSNTSEQSTQRSYVVVQYIRALTEDGRTVMVPVSTRPATEAEIQQGLAQQAMMSALSSCVTQ